MPLLSTSRSWPRPPLRAGGFTLLELLAVLLIIGITISFASLSLGQNSSRIVQDEAERLHGLIQLAAEEAVLQGRDLALEFGRDRYRFLEWSRDAWQPVEDDTLLRERPLPDVVEMQLILEGLPASFEDKNSLPKLFILSSGELTPFELILKNDEGDAYTLQGQLNGKLTLASNDDDEDR